MSEPPVERLLLLDLQRAKAAIAWPLVRRHRSPGQFRAKAGPRSYYSPMEWMEIAGLPMFAHDDVAPVLFRSELIGPDGMVDRQVINYARKLVASKLRKSK